MLGHDVMARLHSARAIFLDWDGCLVEARSLKPGARELIELFGDKIFVLSNNSTNLPTHFARYLRSHQAPIADARIFLAGHRAVDFVAAHYPRDPVYFIGSEGLRRYGRNRGLSYGEHEARTVLLLRDTKFNYAKLDAAANFLRRGARLIVANPDLTHPRGTDVVPETGALMAALGACVDLSRTEVTTVGKPEQFLFELALSAAGVPASDVVMIGDNPATDIAGARAMGIPGVLLNEAHGLSLATIMNSGPHAISVGS